MSQETTVVNRENIAAIQAAARAAVGENSTALPPVKPDAASANAPVIPEGFPEKFIKDGKPDYAALAKSYAELEKAKAPAKTADAPKDGEQPPKKDEQKTDDTKEERIKSEPTTGRR